MHIGGTWELGEHRMGDGRVGDGGWSMQGDLAGKLGRDKMWSNFCLTC